MPVEGKPDLSLKSQRLQLFYGKLLWFVQKYIDIVIHWNNRSPGAISVGRINMATESFNICSFKDMNNYAVHKIVQIIKISRIIKTALRLGYLTE